MTRIDNLLYDTYLNIMSCGLLLSTLSTNKKPEISTHVGGVMMNHIKCFFYALVLSVIASGCAFSPVNQPEEGRYSSQVKVSKSVSLEKNKAMDAVESSLRLLGYEVHISDKKLLIVRSKPAQVGVPEYCDCGTWNGAVVTGFATSVLIISFAEESKTKTSVNLVHECATTFTGRNLYGGVTRQETYHCASRGVMEDKFWALLEKY